MGSSVSKTLLGYRLLKQLKLTTSGTYTPTAGVKAIKFILKGGGGGTGGLAGGSTATGGGGEGCKAIFLETVIASSYVYTIGAGGVAGNNSGGNGGDGNNTTINGITAHGGKGSLGSPSPALTEGGSGSDTVSGTIDYKIKGHSGGTPSFVASNAIGGEGGGEGGGKGSKDAVGGVGVDGGGGGGSAAISTPKTGAVGGDGYIIVEEYY